MDLVAYGAGAPMIGYAISVSASGSFSGTTYPQILLSIDGTNYDSVFVTSNNVTSYLFGTIQLTPGAHDVSLTYPNHTSSSQMVNVQSISINGDTVGTSSPTETYDSPNGDFTQWGQMYFGGTINFNLGQSYFPASAPTPAPTPTPTPTPPGGSITVGGGSQYTTLQQGIQAAEQAGSHMVVVNPGTYIENNALTAADDGLSILAASGGVTLAGSMSITGGSGIAISGLTFQGNGSNVAIDAVNSSNLTIKNNTFTGTGEGIVLDGTGGSSVSDNVMTNTANSAIEAKNGANADVFDSNVITGDNAPNTTGAIWLHGSDNTTITHNQISNTAGAAISLSDFYGPGTTATQNNNTLVAYNSLFDVDTQSSDSGAIYILGRSQDPNINDVVKMNFIGSTGSPGAHAVGIYLDDNASGVSVTQNIVQATPNMSDAYEIHGGSNDSFSGNIFDLGTGATSFGLFQQDASNEEPQGSFASLENDLVSGNIFVTESTSPHNPGFANLTGGIGEVSVTKNDFWSFGGAPLNVGGNGPTGDSAAQYVEPSAQGAASLSGYSAWSGDGINFQSISTSLIGPSAGA